MKDLTPITRISQEDFSKLEEILEFNSEEQKYFDDMKQRRDSKFNKKAYADKLQFYLQELEAIKGKFDGRIAVERMLKYFIGHAYEDVGTHTLEGKDPKERYPMFEQAVIWYQGADETMGYLSDYAMRQAQSCFGAAHFRKKAGLNDEVTEWFAERGNYLLNTYFGGNVILIKGKIPDYIKAIADNKVEGVANAYLINISKKIREN